MTREHELKYGPNVTAIVCKGTRIIRGTVPQQVRRQLALAAKDNILGRFPKDGLLPEIYYHPDHKHSAERMRREEAVYSAQCIGKCFANDSLIAAERLMQED